MARKINVKLILELREAGMSRSAIASARKISRNSVSDVFNIADEKRITFSDVSGMSDEEAYRLYRYHIQEAPLLPMCFPITFMQKTLFSYSHNRVLWENIFCR